MTKENSSQYIHNQLKSCENNPGKMLGERTDCVTVWISLKYLVLLWENIWSNLMPTSTLTCWNISSFIPNFSPGWVLLMKFLQFIHIFRKEEKQMWINPSLFGQNRGKCTNTNSYNERKSCDPARTWTWNLRYSIATHLTMCGTWADLQKNTF